MSRPAWSYTALNTFVQCPRQYQLTKVTKELPFVETEEIKYGKEVHKALELRVKDDKALPAYLSHLEPLMQTITSSDGTKHTERKQTINEEFKPVTWFSKEAWCRSIDDISIKKKNETWIGDYKTGKRRPGSDQLMLFAAIEMHHDPVVERVKTSFIWTKDKKIDTETYTRDQLSAIWKHFMPKVARLEAAFEQDKWPAKPSGLCGWCPATKAQCEFAKKG